MSDKIRTFAGKWKDMIYIFTFVLTGLGVVGAANRWVGRQEEKDMYQSKRMEYYDAKIAQHDTILVSISNNQKQVAILLSAMKDMQINWEAEHIELLKIHGIYPKKLYRGDVK